MRIAVTGASGNLGSACIEYFSHRNGGVISVPSSYYRPRVFKEELSGLLAAEKITSIIHCAALTDVDFAEKNPDLAREANVGITRDLCSIAESLKIRFILISSTGVYGCDSFAANGASFEARIRSPLNVYHKSKCDAEDIVLRECPGGLVVRVGWLFGGASKTGKDFFVSRIQEMALLRDDEEYIANADQFGNPTSSKFVAKALHALILHDVSGVYNCVNDGATSRYELVKAIKEACGFSFTLKAVPNTFFQRPARAPLNEAASNAKLRRIIDTEHWYDDVVALCTLLKNQNWRLR